AALYGASLSVGSSVHSLPDLYFGCGVFTSTVYPGHRSPPDSGWLPVSTLIADQRRYDRTSARYHKADPQQLKGVFLVAQVRPHHACPFPKRVQSNLRPQRAFVVGDAFIGGGVWWGLGVFHSSQPCRGSAR